MNFMQKYFEPIASKVEGNKFISSIKNGMIALISILIIGSFTLIISSIGNLFPDGTVIKDFFVNYADILDLPFNYTYGLLAVYSAITISYSHARQINAPILQSIIAGVMSTLILNTKFVDGNLATGYLDSRGIFVSIVSSLVVVEVLGLFIRKRITLRFKGLPEMVASTFESIIPLLVVLCGTVLVSIAIQAMTGGLIVSEFLTQMLAPAINSLDTPYAVFIIAFLEMLFWFIGLNGYAILIGVVLPFMTQYLGANATAYANGEPIPHVFAPNFWDYFMGFTGSGITGALVLLAIFSKSKRIKAIGKASFVPMIFTISEPVVYGLPICYNPYLFIPFVFGTPILATIQWVIFHVGWVRPPIANVGGAPIFLANYLSTVDWRAILLAAGVLIIGIVMYYPFFKMYEKSVLEEEIKEVSKEEQYAELDLDF